MITIYLYLNIYYKNSTQSTNKNVNKINIQDMKWHKMGSQSKRYVI